MWCDHTFSKRSKAIKRAKKGGESWAKFENGVVSNIAGLYRIGS